MDAQTICNLLVMVRQRMGADYTVTPDVALKNNNTRHSCFVIHKKGNDTDMRVYIGNHLYEVEHGEKSVYEVAEEIVRECHVNMKGNGYATLIDGVEKKDILQNVIHCLVNAASNRLYLSDKVFWRFLDLAVVYRFIVEETKEGMRSTVLTKGICEHYNIHMEELEEAAQENTRKRGFFVKTLEQYMAKLMGIEVFEEPEKDAPLWVCTSSNCINGAAIMLHSEPLAGLAELLGDDLILLPSSIHEIIALPAKVGLKNAEDIIAEVNSTQVPTDEILGDNPYYFNRQTMEVTIFNP